MVVHTRPLRAPRYSLACSVNDASFPATNCSRWPRGDGPNPGCTPEPAGPGNAGWSAAPAGPGPTGPTAKPSGCSSRSANRDRADGAAPVSGPDAASRQTPTPARPRRSAPTTMSTRRPPWSAQGSSRRRYCRPPEQATRSQPGDLPGPDRRPRYAQARGTPTPRDLPADLGWPGGVPDRPPTTRQPRRPRALRATPSQPSPNRIDQHTRGGPEGVNRRDHSEPHRRGMARPRRDCPAWVREQSKHGYAETQWQTPRRRRRTDGARLRRNPNVRRGRLHRPALPVQPRSALRDPPRLGSAEGTKGNGSSWIFEPRLTWANVLRRVQQPAFSLVTQPRRRRP
jgi:hypothetical protein